MYLLYVLIVCSSLMYHLYVLGIRVCTGYMFALYILVVCTSYWFYVLAVCSLVVCKSYLY